MAPKTIKVGGFEIGAGRPLALIAGPCVIEGRESALRHASFLKEVADRVGVPFIYKSSYDKANRTSLDSYRGPGIENGLKILAQVKKEIGVPVLTDVHEKEQIALVKEDVDILQIPAFLCRQTDFVIAVARSGRVVNIKKGQFLAPWDLRNVVEKIVSTGNDQIMVTERGVSFGYNNLVADMRSLVVMKELGYPVVFDATHSVQQPGGKGTATGGQREFVPVLARSAISLGIAAVFIETHQDPDNAPSDGPNMVKLKDMPALLETLMAFDRLAKSNPLSLAS